MSHVVLGLLILLGPQTIYALNKQFEQGVSLFYRASLGALRTALLGLVDRGEVVFDESVEQGRRKKLYRPTEAGAEAFFGWLNGPIEGSDVETTALAKLFFLGLLDDAGQRRAVLDGIVVRVTADLGELDATAEVLDAIEFPPGFERAFRYQRATLAYGQAAHRLARDHFAALRDAET